MKDGASQLQDSMFSNSLTNLRYPVEVTKKLREQKLTYLFKNAFAFYLNTIRRENELQPNNKRTKALGKVLKAAEGIHRQRMHEKALEKAKTSNSNRNAAQFEKIHQKDEIIGGEKFKKIKMKTEYAANIMMMQSVRQINLLTSAVEENETDHFRVDQSSDDDDNLMMVSSNDNNPSRRD